VRGTILTSRDGVKWTKQVSWTDGLLEGVTYGNGIFVAVGRTGEGEVRGTILTSRDGVKWTERVLGTDGWLNDVTYGNGIFVAVGAVFITGPDSPPNGTILTPPGRREMDQAGLGDEE